MIVFEMQCKNGHLFEGWFENSEDFEQRQSSGQILCPFCGVHEVKRVLSPIAIRKHRPNPPSEGPSEAFKLQLLLKKTWEYVEKNFEDVGDKFTAEALKIHYGLTEPRNIRGVATKEEEEVLKEEGVKFFKLPSPAPMPEVSMN